MVDTKCGFAKGKYKRHENEINSQATPDDESLLMQPLQTSCLGFREAKKAYENGTDEVRQLLMQECSLIYECNMCRNMFRSLANFIRHKRHYCKSTSTNNFHSFSDRSSSMLIQTVERSEPLLVKSRSTGNSPTPSPKSSNGDLSKVIERLKRVEVSSDCSQYKNVAVKCEIELPSMDPKASDPVLELEHVSTTTNAVYQTLKTKNDSDSIKTELDEVHNLLANRKIILGLDGKEINSTEVKSFKLPDKMLGEHNCETTNLLPEMSCQICRISFQTEKTLKMHVQKNHTSSTYVFQCPTCAMTFLQPAAVIRHLANEHKKPLRRIRKMRDTILKKRIQIGDVQVKGLDREVKRLQISNTKDLDCSNMVDQQKSRFIPSCSYCLKNFERRAALATHLVNCVVRKMSLRNTGLTNDLGIDTKVENQNSNQLSDNSGINDKEHCNKFEKRTEIKVNIKQEPEEDLTMSNNSLDINKLFENLENQTFGKGLHTVCLENLQMMDESKEAGGEKQEEIRNEVNTRNDSCADQSYEENSKNDITIRGKSIKKEKSKRFRIVSATKQLTCRCKICNKQFNALSNLRRHISMFHYRSKRFGCNLCDYRAFRRYDIVNHLTFVHKMTGERESMAVEYVTVHEIKYSKDDVEGDIVVVNDETIVSEHYKRKAHEQMAKEKHSSESGTAPNSYDKRKKERLQENKNFTQILKKDSIDLKDKSHIKAVRRKLKKGLETQVEDKKRPIRNRIKTVNQDFVYDLLPNKEDPKQTARLTLKRSNTVFIEQNNLTNVELTPPPIKIPPYRLRTEPLIPADKISVRGVAVNICRNAIHNGLAAPSTLPEMPTERPQMRPRLISSSRSDSNPVPIIETSELEAAGLKSTFFDDSFLEKFAKKSNPSFKMKPLLAMQHSPLNSILQKFDASQQHIARSTENKNFQNPVEKNNNPPPHNSTCLKQPNTKEKDVTPNGKQIIEPSSPPTAPKKRITLMERLAENRAKRRDTTSSFVMH